MKNDAFTVEELKARLRAFGLPVGGSRDAMLERIRHLDDLRDQFGSSPEAVERLTVVELRQVLKGLQLGSSYPRAKAGLVKVVARLATMAEPAPEGPRQPRRALEESVVWLNPATLRLEVHSTVRGLERARAVVSEVRERVRTAIVFLSKFLPEFSAGGAHAEPEVRLGPDSSAFDPRHTRAEQEAQEALAALVVLEQNGAGVAFSGDPAKVRAMRTAQERELTRLRRAREEVWRERGE